MWLSRLEPRLANIWDRRFNPLGGKPFAPFLAKRIIALGCMGDVEGEFGTDRMGIRRDLEVGWISELTKTLHFEI